MADSNVETKLDAVVEAVKAPVKAVVDAVETPAKAVVEMVKAPIKAATKTVKTPVIKARKAITRRKARLAPAKLAKAVKQVNKRVVKTARKVRQASVAVTKTQIERTNTMAYDFTKYDFTKYFGGFDMPTTDKFETLFADAGAKGQEIVVKTQKAAEEMTGLAKANVEAMVEAGRIATSGAKSIGQDVIASSRDGLEKAASAVKTLADAKSPTEFFQIQSDLMRTQFDYAVAETSKLTEQMVKLIGEAVQPLSSRASINAERFNALVA